MSRKLYVLIGALLLTSCIFFSLNNVKSKPTDENFVYVAEVDGTIDAGVSHYLDKAVGTAEGDNAPLLIKLDTPGGLVSPTKDIVNRILDSDVTVAVWVTPKGAWAYSAGTYILMSSDVAAMDNGTSIGAAEPRPSDNKTLEAMISWMSEIAEAQNRPSKIAKEFVSKNKTMGPQDALDENIIDLRATDTQDILENIGVTGAETREVWRGTLSRLLSVLSDPRVVLILFIAGLLGILAEVTTPGVGVPGVVGGICLLLSLWGLNIIEIGLLGLALLVLGIILLGVEIIEPGFGVFGVGGVISLLIGLSIIDEEPWTEVSGNIVIGVSLGLLAIFVVFIVFARRALKKPVKTGMESMIGETGTATKDIDPDGVVKVRGELWKATSEERIEKGEGILVKDMTERDGQTTLLVEKLKEE